MTRLREGIDVKRFQTPGLAYAADNQTNMQRHADIWRSCIHGAEEAEGGGDNE